MARNKGKNGWSGVLLGPAIVFFALAALWKNETRFDFYKAASNAKEINSLSEANSGDLISATGKLDPNLAIQGEYVEGFVGYTLVRRHAQIYCWHEDKDDEGTDWRLEWRSSVESNSRNHGIRQELSSSRLLPEEYQLDDLTIDSKRMEFVDSAKDISTSSLKLVAPKLVNEGKYFFLRKYNGNNLGDERIRYDGIPVPEIASYFGKFENGKAVADTSNERTGWINKIIQDTGILHHLVAGERDTALASMKSYLSFIKWSIRGAGSTAVVIGFWILFGSIFSFLFHWPIIGRIAETGTFLLALVLGVPLAILTICASYLFAHPILLVLLVLGIGALVYFLRQRGQKTQQAVAKQVTSQFGAQLKNFSLKELEFIELAKMARVDGAVAQNELQFLYGWGKKHGWDQGRCDELMAQSGSASDQDAVSNEEHLKNLVRLALADGKLTRYEIQSIRTAAKKFGYDDKTVDQWMNQIRQMAPAV